MADRDLIIIGAGPAGLTAAQYGARANLNVLVIEKLSAGGQALVIDVLENYPGNTAPDGVGTQPKSGCEFAMDLHKQAESFGASFLFDQVNALKIDGGLFEVVMQGGSQLKAKAVIIAAGAKPRKLDIPGENEFAGRGVSYCATCDGNFFKGKKVFVVGGGDSACDESRYLSKIAAKVILVHRRDTLRAQKALVKRTLENAGIEVRFNTIIKEIKGGGGGAAALSAQKVNVVMLENLSTGEVYEEQADAVFIAAGSVPQSELVKDLNVTLDDAGGIVTDQNMATNIPGLYAAGDIRAGTFRQVVTAAADGATAAHNAAKYIGD